MDYTPPQPITITVTNKSQMTVKRNTTCTAPGFAPTKAYAGQVFTILYSEGDYHFGLLGSVVTGTYCWLQRSDLQ